MASHSRIRQTVKMKVESKEKTIKERNQFNGHGSSFVVLNGANGWIRTSIFNLMRIMLYH